MLPPSFVAADDAGAVLALLRRQLDVLVRRSPFYRELFAEHGVAPAAFDSIEAISKFPFTGKQMLRESQAAAPPLGRHAAVGMAQVVRVHASTGTTGRPSWVGVTSRDAEAWTEMTASAMRRQGLVASDVVVHGAGLTLFVGGLPVRDAIERIGATMVPIGTGASEKAALAMSSLGVTTLHSTPSYARYLAEYVRERLGRDPREFGLTKIMVGGEPGGGEPAFREHIQNEWGATVTEGLGNADMAPILFAERPGTAGMRYTGGKHVLVELIDPVTGDAIDPEAGASGELVYTAVDRECCPLVRFRTRDRVTVTGMDTDGAPLIRCIGRTDDMLIVLGVNVFPSAVRDLVQTLHPRTSGAIQVVLPGEGPRVEPPLRVEAEWGESRDDGLAREIEVLIKARLSVPAAVTLVPPGSLGRSEMKTRLTRLDGQHTP
ncbi:phenylacetate--CoA ligase family protein [Amycolatopsis acidiphila]|uniref:Phenylacetate--CoA ligase n=1 Tax=Amycolatopsis acidiphila TaxID=715473 RepID=A0A557ZSL1_9PSEU|nr:phenylacetate--CoA ligase [Amycolatopsis acidiphila]TVT14995.1 phenylacetate--CoA ligase [Amycolatopsis acidiphila]UIJ58493.1 phenylacetate--CoA ligase family protein [Amycolatopsis acidiphila]GHG77192.1 phenylacetate--CoA ligase [Amycolatopsis acidiphila]